MALFSYSQEEEEDETHKAQLSINRKAKTMRQRRINAKLAAFKVVSTIYSSNNENNSTTSRHRLAIDSSSFLSKNVVFLTLFIVIMFLSLSSSSMIIFVDACQIQGTESGYCSYRYLPETYGGEFVRISWFYITFYYFICLFISIQYLGNSHEYCFSQTVHF